MNDQTNAKLHWLERPGTIRWLWRGGFFILALTVLGEFFYHAHSDFVVDGWFAFNAAYGFLACLVMVLFAKLLGVFVKRDDTFYDPPEGEAE